MIAYRGLPSVWPSYSFDAYIMAAASFRCQNTSYRNPDAKPTQSYEFQAHEM